MSTHIGVVTGLSALGRHTDMQVEGHVHPHLFCVTLQHDIVITKVHTKGPQNAVTKAEREGKEKHLMLS